MNNLKYCNSADIYIYIPNILNLLFSTCCVNAMPSIYNAMKDYLNRYCKLSGDQGGKMHERWSGDEN